MIPAEVTWDSRSGGALRPQRPGQARTGRLPAGQDEEFVLKLINRPILVLRGQDGFVCHRRGSNQLDTNRSVYDVFHLSFSDGAYQIRGSAAGAGREAGWEPRGEGRGVRVRSAPPTTAHPQAAAAGSGTRAATAACAATASGPRTSSSSSASAAAWPSAPGAASTCAAAPRGCCARTQTRLRGSHSGSTEPWVLSTRVPIKPSAQRLVAGAAPRTGGRVCPGPRPLGGLRLALSTPLPETQCLGLLRAAGSTPSCTTTALGFLLSRPPPSNFSPKPEKTPSGLRPLGGPYRQAS